MINYIPSTVPGSTYRTSYDDTLHIKFVPSRRKIAVCNVPSTHVGLPATIADVIDGAFGDGDDYDCQEYQYTEIKWSNK